MPLAASPSEAGRADGVVLRRLEDADLDAAADVVFRAFARVDREHGQRGLLATAADARTYVRYLQLADPASGVVAELDGVIVAAGWVRVVGPIATVGPLVVEPALQGSGIGRRVGNALTHGLLDTHRLAHLRIVQDAFNTTALGFYLRRGFRVAAPLLWMERAVRAADAPPLPPWPLPPGLVVRPAGAGDVPALVARDARAFGAPRGAQLALYLARGRALVGERDGRLVGYALGVGQGGIGWVGPAAADDGRDLVALVGRSRASPARAASRSAPSCTAATISSCARCSRSTSA